MHFTLTSHFHLDSHSSHVQQPAVSVALHGAALDFNEGGVDSERPGVELGGFFSQLFKMEVESRVEEKQRHQQQETWMDLPTPGKLSKDRRTQRLRGSREATWRC